jgi:hypothetical protein
VQQETSAAAEFRAIALRPFHSALQGANGCGFGGGGARGGGAPYHQLWDGTGAAQSLELPPMENTTLEAVVAGLEQLSTSQKFDRI